MNQDQRKFLIERVNRTFNIQKKKIEESVVLVEPSLNNYLIAAFLDNSISFNDIEKLKTKMRTTVLKMGASDVLVKSESDWRSNRSKNKNTCEILAEDLFVIPDAYTKALQEYQTAKVELERQVTDLEAHRDTILLKIQIGSNQVLDKLVTQVDNLADLNIMNNQFLLT